MSEFKNKGAAMRLGQNGESSWVEEEYSSNRDLRLGALIAILFFIGVALGLFFELLI